MRHSGKKQLIILQFDNLGDQMIEFQKAYF